MTESSDTPVARERERQLISWLKSSREEYRESLKRHLDMYAKANKEGWFVHGSHFTQPDEKGNQTAYFAPAWKATDSFEHVGGFDAEKLINHIVRFFSTPYNEDRAVILLDAMGQGVAVAEIRDEVLKRVPYATISVVATALTPYGNDAQKLGIREFVGDMLSDESEQVFFFLEKERRQGGTLFVTFFRPVGGLDQHQGNSFVAYACYTRLARLFEMTEREGLLFIQSPTAINELDFLSSLLERYRARELLSNSINDRGLLSKDTAILDRSTLPRRNGLITLPTVREIVEKHWDLVEKYWYVPKSA